MSLLYLKQDHRFYQKAQELLSNGLTKASIKQAASYLSCLPADYCPKALLISSEALTQIALADQQAALAILENTYFSGQLSADQLSRVANSSLKIAMYVLYDQHFLKKFSQVHFAGGLKEARLFFINALAEARMSYANEV